MLSSSTSSSKHLWQRFFRLFSSSLLLAVAGLYISVLLIDPYDSLSFSPPAERSPVNKDRRRALPALARYPQFNGVILGTSTSMLLKPSSFDRLADASFVNLAFPAASPWEQKTMLSLFTKHHPEIKYVVIGLDDAWCHPHGAEQFLGAGNKNKFPAWLYDENHWNDFPPISERTLRHARMQASSILGWANGSTNMDGYYDFTSDLYGEYDLETAREYIYGDKGPSHATSDLTPTRKLNLDQASFSDLSQLKEMLSELPVQTKRLLFFTPYHIAHQPASNTTSGYMWSVCKQRADRIASELPNTAVVDFFIESTITIKDHNYWDDKHYTREVATQIEHALVSLLEGESVDVGTDRIYERRGPLHKTGRNEEDMPGTQYLTRNLALRIKSEF